MFVHPTNVIACNDAAQEVRTQWIKPQELLYFVRAVQIET
jgi:hypothetical protein